ncbi:MAG: hypothetical protein U0Q55_24010, partial [Vicinamibacterales bacterium]
MITRALRVCAVFASVLATAAVSLAQTRPSSRPVVYEGARLIVGDGSAPIESGVFVVQDGTFTAVGAAGSVAVPAGATRVNLAGRTVMPALLNAHVHIGYE